MSCLACWKDTTKQLRNITESSLLSITLVSLSKVFEGDRKDSLILRLKILSFKFE